MTVLGNWAFAISIAIQILDTGFLYLDDPPPCAPTNGRPGFPFGFLGAGGRLPKARRRRVFIVYITTTTGWWLVVLLVTPTPHALLCHNRGTSQPAREICVSGAVGVYMGRNGGFSFVSLI